MRKRGTHKQGMWRVAILALLVSMWLMYWGRKPPSPLGGASSGETSKAPAKSPADVPSLAELTAAHRVEAGTVLPVSGRAFVIRRPHERRPPGDAAAFARTLLPASARGDSVASYRLYLVTSECEASISPDILQADQLMAEWLPPNQAELSAREMEECEALLLDPGLADRRAWLRLAAEQGSVEAAAVYAISIEEAVGGPEAWATHPEKVIEYKRQAVRYLEGAAAAGSVEALSGLAQTYVGGFLVPEDLVRALAYEIVVDRVHPSEGSRGLRTDLERRVSTGQRDEARRQAEAIYRQCCA
jgi:hypothetical protein